VVATNDAKTGHLAMRDPYPQGSNLLTSLIPEAVVEITVAIVARPQRPTRLARSGDISSAGGVELLVESTEQEPVERDDSDDTDDGERNTHHRQQSGKNPEPQSPTIPPSKRRAAVRKGDSTTCHVTGRNT
jgi:hypothetical protein